MTKRLGMQITIALALVVAAAIPVWSLRLNEFADPALLDMSGFALETQTSQPLDLEIPKEFIDLSPPTEEEMILLPPDRDSA